MIIKIATSAGQEDDADDFVTNVIKKNWHWIMPCEEAAQKHTDERTVLKAFDNRDKQMCTQGLSSTCNIRLQCKHKTSLPFLQEQDTGTVVQRHETFIAKSKGGRGEGWDENAPTAGQVT